MNVKELVSKMTLEEKASLLSGADFWHTKGIERLGIPQFMMCDGPNGLRKQEGESDHLGIHGSISTVCYPTASAVAASFDEDMARQLGERLGDECQREDVSMLLGPGLNMKRSPICGRNFEYYSEDPYLAGKIATAYVKGLQSKGISACPKHFAANNQEYRRMSGSSQVDERTLHEIYLPAFEMVVKEARPKSIMCSYNKINGTPLSENKYMLTDVLRDKWGFDGFVVTDWGAARGAEKGVKAGLDLAMPGGSDDYEKAVIKAVKAGTLDEKLVDNAVTNILKNLDWTLENKKKDAKASDDATRKADYEFARDLAENSAVLLKNERRTLPLKEDSKVLFVGEFAKKPRYQGSGSSHINSAHVSNAYDEAQKRGISFAQGYDLKDKSRNLALREEALEAAKKADVVVIFAGLPDSYESEGFDRKDINIPPEQDKLIMELAENCRKTVVVMHNGAPVAMPWIDKVSAVLDMQLAGDAVGEATVRLLWGEANPSGKLPETYPVKLSDNPSFLNFPGEGGNPVYAEGIFMGYRYYEKKRIQPLFAFGHGLSYTEFDYCNFHIDKTQATDKDEITVSVDVWNVGRYPGKEIVQLYVSRPESRYARPLKELKGFKKVELKPEEKKTVTFTLDGRSFACYNTQIHDFYVESGVYTVMIGASSVDIRMAEDVTIKGTTALPTDFDLLTPIADILDDDKGKEVFGPIIEKAQPEDGSEDALGEGTVEMMKNMLLEMPVKALSSFGMVNEETLLEMLDKLK